MSEHIRAIFEHGLLRPLEPLNLAESQLVSLSIEVVKTDGEANGSDEYWPLIAGEGDREIPLSEIRAILAKLPDSVVEAFDRDRDERI